MAFTPLTRNVALNMLSNQRARTGLKGAFPNINTAYATALQTVNNSAVLVSHTELGCQVTQGVSYYLECFIGIAIAAAGNGIQLDLNGGGYPNGQGTVGTGQGALASVATAVITNVIGNAQFLLTGSGTTFGVDSVAINTAMSGGTTNAWSRVMINACFLCTSTGTLGIRFAQAVAGATNTSILPGSMLSLTPLDPMYIQS